MRTLKIVLTAAFVLAACDSKESDGKADGKAAEAGPDYSAIDTKVKAAKSGDDWLKITMECGSLEMDAAMKGNSKLGEDAEFNKHCGTGLKIARAKQVVELSKPDKMHDSCITASMDMDELIEKGKGGDEAKALKDKVNAACGL
ncbi:MAG: hypothetical protein K0V04_08070 [Deltaproteobacteria bacterium]|nr:hypothetical protein [Deltaproteobacteria bacterium]